MSTTGDGGPAFPVPPPRLNANNDYIAESDRLSAELAQARAVLTSLLTLHDESSDSVQIPDLFKWRDAWAEARAILAKEPTNG